MVTLLDYLGRPIRQTELKSEEQTARVAFLHQEFSTHPSRGLTPTKLARILDSAEQGDLMAQAQLAEDMEEKDGHLFAELSKRKRAILGLDWSLEPPDDASAAEKEAVARVEAIIRDLDVEDILFDCADAILKGYSCQEISWDRSEGEWRPAKIEFRPADWFTCRPEDRNTLLLRSTSAQGEPLRPWGWIVHHHKAKSGYVVRGGLARVLAWPYLFRNYSARDLAEFLEIYGLPLRVGTYPPGSSEQERATLMRAVVAIGHAAAGIIPEGMKVEFQEAAKGASDPFMAMIDWSERSMSKAILGGTLTTQTDKGSGAYALGEVHDEVRMDIRASDTRQIGRTLVRDLAIPLLRLNTSMARAPRWNWDDGEAEDFSIVDPLVKLAGAGATIPVSWVSGKLRIPEPEGDEPVLTVSNKEAGESLPPRPPQAISRFARNSVAALSVSPNDVSDRSDTLNDRLANESSQILDALADEIRSIVDQAQSLEDLRKRLIDAWPSMDRKDLAELMAEALTAAELAGRFDILEEAS